MTVINSFQPFMPAKQPRFKAVTGNFNEKELREALKVVYKNYTTGQENHQAVVDEQTGKIMAGLSPAIGRFRDSKVELKLELEKTHDNTPDYILWARAHKDGDVKEIPVPLELSHTLEDKDMRRFFDKVNSWKD